MKALVMMSKRLMSFNNADSSITVKLNSLKTKMIMDTGCKYMYNTIPSTLYQSQFKNFEQTNIRSRVHTHYSI